MEPYPLEPLQVILDLVLMAMRGTPLSLLQNWSLTIRCSLISYPEHPFLEWWGQVLYICREFSQYILSLTDQAIDITEITWKFY